MDSLLVQSTDPGNLSSLSQSSYSAKAYADSAAIQTIGSVSNDSDTVNISFDDLYKSLSITGQKLIDKLNELLKTSLPNGVQSLKPEEVTSEATADRIVSQTTALFGIYAERHPDLEGEELLSGFMDTIRSGIQSGYEDAFQTLDSLGAFEFNGVQSGIEKTMQLVDQKLKAYEQSMRKQLGIDPAAEVTKESIAPTVKNGVLAQAGASTLSIAA